MIVPLSAVDDPRIASYLGLRDHVARQVQEQPNGRWAGSFIAESNLIIDRALTAGQRLLSILVDARRVDSLTSAVPAGVPVFAATPSVLTEVCGRPKLRDPLARFERPPLPSAEDLLATEARAVAVLENVTNPNNMGVIMRCAAGLGIDAVFIDPTSCDPLYRRSIRASMGEVFALPHARLTGLPDGLGCLTEAGFSVVGLTPDSDAVPMAAVDLRAMDRVAIFLGAEGPGLSDDALAAATMRVRIPMANNVDSLNVAAAAAIAFHAAVRAPEETARPGETAAPEERR